MILSAMAGGLALLMQGVGVELYVAPDGDDTNPGTAAAPFATLERARDVLRAQGAAGSTVWLAGGDYLRARSFGLGAEDGGAAGHPVVYRALPGAVPRLIGGQAIPAEAWTASDDSRLDPAARGQVLTCELAALGVTDLGTFPDAFHGPPAVPELFWNDERMILARWPNDDWATTENCIDPGSIPRTGQAEARPGIIGYEGDRPARWNPASGVWLYGYWCFDWYDEAVRVAEIDPVERRITFARPHVYGFKRRNPGPARFYAINLLEELDSPGEYYIDREQGRLYFWPPSPPAEARAFVSTLREPLIRIDGASHVSIQGLTCEMTAGAAITVNDGADVQIAGCTVRNTGTYGIGITGGERHTVVSCDIHDTGTIGVQVSGGDRRSLTPCGHEVVNCHIWRVSRRQRTYAGHVHVGGVGVRVAHNLLHDSPHQAIGLGGNDHLIEFNDIHHTNLETDDCGAFYTGRNPSEKGTVLRYNLWHHIGSDRAHGSAAVYIDDGSGGYLVYGNIFYRACGGNFGAVFYHGGHDNRIENCIFVDCKMAFAHSPWNDERWAKWLEEPDTRRKLLTDVDITQPPYTERYPELLGFLEPGGRPRVNYASRNLVVGCAALKRGNIEEQDDFVTDTDPGFIDPEHLDFRPREGSVVFERIPGFEVIPFERIGPYVDEWRPQLPELGRER